MTAETFKVKIQFYSSALDKISFNFTTKSNTNILDLMPHSECQHL